MVYLLQSEHIRSRIIHQYSEIIQNLQYKTSLTMLASFDVATQSGLPKCEPARPDLDIFL